MPLDVTMNVETLREPNEPEVKWKLRRAFILANYRTVRNFERLLTLSRCFVNVRTSGCGYPDHIMKQLEELTASVRPVLPSGLRSDVPIVNVDPDATADDRPTHNVPDQLAVLQTPQTTEQTTNCITISLEKRSQIQTLLRSHLLNPLSLLPSITQVSGRQHGTSSVNEPPARGQKRSICISNGPAGAVGVGSINQPVQKLRVNTSSNSLSAQCNKALLQCLKSIAIEPCCSEPTNLNQPARETEDDSGTNKLHDDLSSRSLLPSGDTREGSELNVSPHEFLSNRLRPSRSLLTPRDTRYGSELNVSPHEFLPKHLRPATKFAHESAETQSSPGRINPHLLTVPSAQLRGGRCEQKRVKSELCKQMSLAPVKARSRELVFSPSSRPPRSNTGDCAGSKTQELPFRSLSLPIKLNNESIKTESNSLSRRAPCDTGTPQVDRLSSGGPCGPQPTGTSRTKRVAKVQPEAEPLGQDLRMFGEHSQELTTLSTLLPPVKRGKVTLEHSQDGIDKISTSHMATCRGNLDVLTETFNRHEHESTSELTPEFQPEAGDYGVESLKMKPELEARDASSSRTVLLTAEMVKEVGHPERKSFDLPSDVERVVSRSSATVSSTRFSGERSGDGLVKDEPVTVKQEPVSVKDEPSWTVQGTEKIKRELIRAEEAPVQINPCSPRGPCGPLPTGTSGAQVVKEKPDCSTQEPVWIKEEPVRIKEEPDRIKQEPAEIQGEAVWIKEEPDCINQEPVGIKEEPMGIKEAPDCINEEAVWIKEELDCVNREPEGIKEEPVGITEAPDCINRQPAGILGEAVWIEEKPDCVNREPVEMKKEPVWIKQEAECITEEFVMVKDEPVTVIPSIYTSPCAQLECMTEKSTMVKDEPVIVNPSIHTPPCAQLRAGWCEHGRVRQEQNSEPVPENLGPDFLSAGPGEPGPQAGDLGYLIEVPVQEPHFGVQFSDLRLYYEHIYPPEEPDPIFQSAMFRCWRDTSPKQLNFRQKQPKLGKGYTSSRIGRYTPLTFMNDMTFVLQGLQALSIYPKDGRSQDSQNCPYQPSNGAFAGTSARKHEECEEKKAGESFLPFQRTQFIPASSRQLRSISGPPVGFFNIEGNRQPLVQFVPASSDKATNETEDVQIGDCESEEMESEEEFDDYSDVDDEIWVSDIDVDNDSELMEIIDSSEEALWFFPDYLDEEVFGVYDDAVERPSTPEPPSAPVENVPSSRKDQQTSEHLHDTSQDKTTRRLISQEQVSNYMFALPSVQLLGGQCWHEIVDQRSPIETSTQLRGECIGDTFSTPFSSTPLQKPPDVVKKPQPATVSPIVPSTQRSGGHCGPKLVRDAWEKVPAPITSTPLTKQPVGRGTVSSTAGQRTTVRLSEHTDEAEDSGVQADLPDGSVLDRIQRICRNIFRPHMQGLCGFVLFYCEHCKPDPAEMLTRSAKMSRMEVQYIVAKEKLGVRCSLKVNNVLVTSAVRAKELDARKTAREWAVQVLRRYCFVLIGKADSCTSKTGKCDMPDTSQTSGIPKSREAKAATPDSCKNAGNALVNPSMLTLPSALLRGGQCEHKSVNEGATSADSKKNAEQTSDKMSSASAKNRPNSGAASLDEPIAANNFGRKIMEKMGWKGGGLGRHRTGIPEPLMMCEVQHEEGIILDSYMVITTSSASKRLKGLVIQKKKQLKKFRRFPRPMYHGVSRNSSMMARRAAALNLRRGGIAFVSAGIQQSSGGRRVLATAQLDQFRRALAIERARQAMVEQARRGMPRDQARLAMFGSAGQMADPAMQRKGVDPASLMAGQPMQKMMDDQARRMPGSSSINVSPGPVPNTLLGSGPANTSLGLRVLGAPPGPLMNASQGFGSANKTPGPGPLNKPPGLGSLCPVPNGDALNPFMLTPPSAQLHGGQLERERVGAMFAQSESLPSTDLGVSSENLSQLSMSVQDDQANPLSPRGPCGPRPTGTSGPQRVEPCSVSGGNANSGMSTRSDQSSHVQDTSTAAPAQTGKDAHTQNDQGAQAFQNYEVRVVDFPEYICKVFGIKQPMAEKVHVGSEHFKLGPLDKDTRRRLDKGTMNHEQQAKDFELQVRGMLTPYLHNAVRSDIVFLPEFNVFERTTIRNVAKELGLVKGEVGIGDDCRITVWPTRSAVELVAFVVACGGKTKQLRVLPPRHFMGKEHLYR